MLLNCSRNCCLLINWGDPRRSVLAKLCKRRNCSAALPAVIGFRNTHHRFCCFSDSCDYSCSYSHIKQSFCQQTFWQQSWVVSAVEFPAPACSLAPCVGEGGFAVDCECLVTQNGSGGTCLAWAIRKVQLLSLQGFGMLRFQSMVAVSLRQRWYQICPCLKPSNMHVSR